MKITIYTDGSSQGNPGPGGYGIVMLSSSGHRKEYSAGYRKTTNNRMELLAVIVALESIKVLNQDVVVYSDSKYVVNAVEKKWVFGWKKSGFKNKKNPDLWKRFLKVFENHLVSFVWVKGHNNNKENERCDRLAVLVAQQVKNHLIDSWYEQDQKKDVELF